MESNPIAANKFITRRGLVNCFDHCNTPEQIIVVPERFDRRGLALTTLFFFVCFGEGKKDPNIKSGPSSTSQRNALNGVSLAGRRWPNIECWLGTFVISHRIRASIATKPFRFVFRGGGRCFLTPCPSLWISADVLTQFPATNICFLSGYVL